MHLQEHAEPNEIVEKETPTPDPEILPERPSHKRKRIEPAPPRHPPALRLVTSPDVAWRMHCAGEANAHAYRKWLRWYYSTEAEEH